MLKWINKKRNKKGFTLVELVVVIAILGVLAAIAVPRLSGSRDNANKKAVEANMRVIDSAISIAEADDKLDSDPTIAELVKGGYLKADPTKTDIETYEIAAATADAGAAGTDGFVAGKPVRAIVSIPENKYGTHGKIENLDYEDLIKLDGWK